MENETREVRARKIFKNGMRKDIESYWQEQGLGRDPRRIRVVGPNSFFYQCLATTEQRAAVDDVIGWDEGLVFFIKEFGVYFPLENYCSNFVDNSHEYL